MKSFIPVLNQYKKLNLFCVCKPKICHGDVIKKFVLEKLIFYKKFLKLLEQKSSKPISNDKTNEEYLKIYEIYLDNQEELKLLKNYNLYEKYIDKIIDLILVYETKYIPKG